jgi:large subunit ribosomal protein L21
MIIMPFAVVLTGGKQYKVAVGDKIRVERLAGEEGKEIDLPHVLLRSKDDKDAELGRPFLDAPVKAKVLKQGKAEKVRVFKMKAKKNYKRTIGHRQPFTELEITKI